MVKKTQNKVSQRASLSIPKSIFESRLDKAIDQAQKILETRVSPMNHGQYSYSSQSQIHQYDNEELDAFDKAFTFWIDEVKEILKQSFDIPDNEYQQDFISAGRDFVYSCNEDILKSYKDEVIAKRNNLESLKNRLYLIPSKIPDTDQTSASKK